jgi:hypothetical protein
MQPEKYTSCHSVNADNRLSIYGRVKWLICNTINNRLPLARLDNSLVYKDFQVSDIDRVWSNIETSSSPARKLCDLFWFNLPLRSWEKKLGGMRAIEIGCGSGTYGFLLNKILAGRVQYRGVDIKPHPGWEAYKHNLAYDFKVADSADIGIYLEDANFIFTQSALEHFEEDLTFFHQIANFVAESQYPIVQLHLIPSASCIATFAWHGIRQYTPRNVSKITRLFPDTTKKTLYRLGSTRCNDVHRRWISDARWRGRNDRREQDLRTYDQELKQAVREDMKNADRLEACFYALLLESVPF